MDKNRKNLAIIGGGNLGSAIARGLLSTKTLSPELIHVTRRRIDLLDNLAREGVVTSNDNVAAVRNADIVLLAVKPFQVAEVCAQIKDHLTPDAILISMATGIANGDLVVMTGGKHPVFRAMPNTAVAIGESMTCLATTNATDEQKAEVERLFTRLGSVVFIPEELMAGATVLAACGIAFALRFVRAATQGGIEIGFSSDLALKIASQTVKGAAQLIIEGKTHPEAEIDKVTTPRGITISGLNEMEHQGFSSSLIKGLLTSFHKIENPDRR